MRKFGYILIVLGLLSLGTITALAAPSPNSGQCPGATDPANTKIDTSDGSVVLDAGLTVCIHAGNGNTGVFVTDGTSTLADYILASGLLNNGGQVPNVSNYVIYPAVPSSPPSEEPSSEPSQPVITPTPSVTPSDTPVPSEPDVVPPTVTPPPTDTEDAGLLSTSDNILALVGIVALVGLALGLTKFKPPINR